MSEASDEGWDETTRDEDTTDPMIGRVLGSRYRVEALLGKGAMGAVYRARHIKVGRPFAIKVLHERLLDDPKLRKRFEREAELAGKLHHINVIGVVDVGETEDGIHFMVMEFAEGTTLGALVDGAMDSKRALNLAQQLCDGLQHAHEHGLIHRDFKPENVIVEKDRFGNERPRIVDFGIAILRDDAVDPTKRDRLTTAGLVLGTPHYMAPEHAMGGCIDHRIDLFALGVIMYELLTGWLPFDGDGVDVARANLIAATPPMGVRVPGIVVDPLLEAFTRLLMQKKPNDRPESAKAARHLLDLIERDRPMAAKILGVELDEPAPPPVVIAPTTSPRSPTPIPSTPVSAPMHLASGEMHALHHDTPLPFRAAIASTPSTRAETVPERVNAKGTVPPSITMDRIPAQQRKVWPIAAGVGAAMMLLAIVIVLMSKKSPSVTTADAAIATAPAEPPVHVEPKTVDTTPAPVAITPEPPASVVVPDKPLDVKPPDARIDPPVVTKPAGTKPAVTRPTVSKPTTPTKPIETKPATPTVTATAEVKPPVAETKPIPTTTKPGAPDTTSSAVALLYGAVGRELKALDTKHGPETSQPMWGRFRQLRINEALATPEKRAAAERMLSQLRRDIAAAM